MPGAVGCLGRFPGVLFSQRWCGMRAAERHCRLRDPLVPAAGVTPTYYDSSRQCSDGEFLPWGLSSGVGHTGLLCTHTPCDSTVV